MGFTKKPPWKIITSLKQCTRPGLPTNPQLVAFEPIANLAAEILPPALVPIWM
jgi:hypothetical protein